MEINKLTKMLMQVVSQNETERKKAMRDVRDTRDVLEIAELLISLYEQERLWASVADGYRLAALCAASVGNNWRAVKWAMRAVETGLIHDGPGDEEVVGEPEGALELGC